MPALSAPFLGFALGAGLYWSVARELSRPVRPLAGHALLIVWGFGVLAYATAVALVLGVEPDWCLAYRIPASRLPGWLTAFWALLCGCSVPLAFAVSRRSVRSRPGAFHQRWFWVPLGLAGAPLVASAPRLGVQATYAQYHGDYAVRAVVGGPLGYFLLALTLGVVLAAWLTRRSLLFLALGGAEGA